MAAFKQNNQTFFHFSKTSAVGKEFFSHNNAFCFQKATMKTSVCQVCSCITVFVTLVATVIALATSAWLRMAGDGSPGLIRACNNIFCYDDIEGRPGIPNLIS